MILHNFDPILIDFGLIQIRWYSLAYIFGILIGWWYGKIILVRQVSQSQSVYLSKFDDPNKFNTLRISDWCEKVDIFRFKLYLSKIL